MQTTNLSQVSQQDPKMGPNADAEEFLPRCPLQKKLGTNLCYCTCPPWIERNKRRIKRLRKLIKKFFTQEDYDVLLLHLIPYAHQICTCPYGNYMIQEVMLGASQTNLQIFISSCPITDIMVNEFGSRVVENLTEMHNGLFVPLVFNRISHIFNRLARNPRANYGVQKLCGIMPLDKYGVVMRVAVPYAARLSMDPHGAYVVQVILNRLQKVAAQGHLRMDDGPNVNEPDSNEPSYSMLENLLNNLVDAGPKMNQHPVGNFTVQAMVAVLALCPSAEKKFINAVCEHIVMYVACKFGTRVVEAVLETGSPHAQARIVNRMLELNDSEFSFFLRTENAQYLYPKVLLCADERQKAAFEDLTNRALAEYANPYAVGLMLEDGLDSCPPLPPSVPVHPGLPHGHGPTLVKDGMGYQSYFSSSSSGSDTIDFEF